MHLNPSLRQLRQGRHWLAAVGAQHGCIVFALGQLLGHAPAFEPGAAPHALAAGLEGEVPDLATLEDIRAHNKMLSGVSKIQPTISPAHDKIAFTISISNSHMKFALSSIAFIFVFSLALAPRATAATDPEICEIRAAVMGSVAQERDKGTSKAKVKRIFESKFGKNYPAFSAYVDLIYDQMKDMSPEEVAKFTKFACSRE